MPAPRDDSGVLPAPRDASGAFPAQREDSAVLFDDTQGDMSRSSAGEDMPLLCTSGDVLTHKEKLTCVFGRPLRALNLPGLKRSYDLLGQAEEVRAKKAKVLLARSTVERLREEVLEKQCELNTAEKAYDASIEEEFKSSVSLLKRTEDWSHDAF